MNLEHFDTILAFAAVMAGLSLVITSLTQSVSGLLGLRGQNLKWGLEKLFAAAAPTLEGRAKVLARHILTHPLLSDSSFSGLKHGWTWWRYASHIRPEELRGLLSAWRDTLELPAAAGPQPTARAHAIQSLHLQPTLNAFAAELGLNVIKTLAEAGISPPLIRKLPAGALRDALAMPATTNREKGRLAKALNALKEQATFQGDLSDLIGLVVTGDGTGPIPPAVAAALPEAVRAVLAMPQSNDSEKAARRRALNELDLPKAFLTEAVEHLKVQLLQIENGVVDWFDACMDRVAQRFTANTRVITIAGAVLISSALVVDSIALWKQLARSQELRNRVIASGDALLKKADEMQVGSTNLPAAVYRVAADQLLAMRTNELVGFSGTAVITNLASGTNWLVAQCQTHGVTNATRWLEEYQALVPQASLRQAADTLQTLLENQLSLGVVSARGPDEAWPAAVRKHFGGIVLSIVLLSLGAPFWFNLLRSLSNLRPVLATKDSQEQQARVKAIAAGKASGGDQ